MKKIGSFWKKESKDKKPYLSGSLEYIAGIKVRVALFPVKEKKSKNSPDYNLVILDDLNTQETKQQTKKEEEFF